jgi:hypothetical protein
MTIRNLALLGGVLVLLGISPQGCSQETTPPAGNPTEQPPTSPLEGLQVTEGILFNLEGTRKTSEFHRVLYKGQMLSERGEAPKNADTTHTFVKDKPEEATSPRVLLDFTHGAGNVTQDTLNALGVDTFPLPTLALYPFHTVTRLAGTLDGKQVNAALGIEAPALHFLTGAANWLILGATFDQQWKKGADTQNGQLTYRLFLGHARWVRFTRTPFTWEDVLRAAPTKLDLLKFNPSASPPTTGIAELDRFLIVQAGFIGPPPGKDPATEDEYLAFIRDGYDRYARGYSLEPGQAFWVESDGWYTVAGKPNGKRFKPLVAVVTTLYGNLNKRSRSSVQLRYEYGYDRTSPTTRLHRVMLNAGLVF